MSSTKSRHIHFHKLHVVNDALSYIASNVLKIKKKTIRILAFLFGRTNNFDRWTSEYQRLSSPWTSSCTRKI